jgi:hypothetical protein
MCNRMWLTTSRLLWQQSLCSHHLNKGKSDTFCTSDGTASFRSFCHETETNFIFSHPDMPFLLDGLNGGNWSCSCLMCCW